MFLAKDSSVFAISDESGNLYKIHLNKNFLPTQWKFDKQHDFEDIFLHDSFFYILESNGNIETLNFSPKGDTIYNRKSIFPAKGKKKNDFESVYYLLQLFRNQKMSKISKVFYISNVNKIRLRTVIYIAIFWTAIDFVIMLLREHEQVHTKSVWFREIFIFL